MTILITGAAGFIGFHLALRLLRDGHEVVGFDNLNDYYSPKLKQARLRLLEGYSRFVFYRADLADAPSVRGVFDCGSIGHVVHLAAQAGVRYSMENPAAYVQSNLVGFANILECCRRAATKHLVFASSSSVYGMNTKVPFSESDNVDHPVSLYAATKKSNELMAHSYSHLYRLPCTGLRFFTAYGPWGRPDMAIYIFTKAILEGRPIPVFNAGQMRRDFTYIDDIIEGVVRLIALPPQGDPEWNAQAPDPADSSAPFALYNIGNNDGVPLNEFIAVLEECLGKKAVRNDLPMQPGDVPTTYADISRLQKKIGYTPSTPLRSGIARFVRWYTEYYGAHAPDS